MNESSFKMIKWKKIVFNNCNLEETEIYKMSLEKLDLSSCNISKIMVSVNDLKGLIVSVDQALSLSLLLGIKIK